MFNYFLILFYFGAVSKALVIVDPGPTHLSSEGEVWPKPQLEDKQDTFFSFDSKSFHISVTNLTCKILTDNVNRYTSILANLEQIVKRIQENIPAKEDSEVSSSNFTKKQENKYLGSIKELKVALTAPCEEYPHLDMVESYELLVGDTSKLNSASIWGIVRGLETFAQLFYVANDYSQIRINVTHILDHPAYQHRGLLLDTARHYVSEQNILLVLDGMQANKMNVFHWHIVDDQSFPYQSQKFPTLSELGAYGPTAVYSKKTIEKIVEYARLRGIRVIPEFDVPGHTSSWGKAYPDILTKCYKNGHFAGLGPMNPINNSTYKVIRELFQEVQELFPDKYFHVGGDEVDMDCWISNPELIKYMMDNQIVSTSELHALFMRTVIPLLQNRSIPIVWQEVFDYAVPLSKDTIVQVWKDDAYKVKMILNAGHRVLYSTPWYLDHLDKNWQFMYRQNPRAMVEDQLLDNVKGGEACMWAEMVDDTNLLSRVWPRASAVAERLWTSPKPEYGRSIPEEVYQRLEEQTCRMRVRGIPASPPSGPGFCRLNK